MPARVDPTNPTLQSDVAEVAWFLRGKTLHRRVLLVVPGVAQNPNSPALPTSPFLCQQRYLGPHGEWPTCAQQPGRPDQARESLRAHPASARFPSMRAVWGFWGFPRWPNVRRRVGWPWVNGIHAAPPRSDRVTQIDYVGQQRISPPPSDCPRERHARSVIARTAPAWPTT